MSKKKTSGSLTTDTSYELGECRKILKDLQNKPEAEAFRHPVDWKGLNLPNYPQIIKKPMDLQTIETKLNRKQYANAFEFAEDMRLVWSNAKTYNQPGSGIFMVAESLGKAWERKFNKIRKASAALAKKDDKSKGRESKQADRLKFIELVKALTSDQLGQVVETIEKKCPQAMHEDSEDDLEIEIHLIDAETLQELIEYATPLVN
jgi:hypothetical protein